MSDRFYGSMEEYLREFERQEWGTNDRKEINQAIIRSEWEAANARMTGMDEEQADWEEDE